MLEDSEELWNNLDNTELFEIIKFTTLRLLLVNQNVQKSVVK